MAQLTAVLDALHALCAEGQVMVDLFVNYDCDLQAANLFERSMKGLSKLLKKTPLTSVFAAQQASKTRDVALDAVLAMLKSLNTWAEPLKVRSGLHDYCKLQVCLQVCLQVVRCVCKWLELRLQACKCVCKIVCKCVCKCLYKCLQACLQELAHMRMRACKAQCKTATMFEAVACKLASHVAGALHIEPWSGDCNKEASAAHHASKMQDANAEHICISCCVGFS